ncbi:hypothetical protein BASA81_013180 [Batrachochytrium salamandrivorans]|nr:hypothetical protein BASA81_013180 [Batrachochytrium salamandrivorans]
MQTFAAKNSILDDGQHGYCASGVSYFLVVAIQYLIECVAAVAALSTAAAVLTVAAARLANLMATIRHHHRLRDKHDQPNGHLVGQQLSLLWIQFPFEIACCLVEESVISGLD